MLSGCGASKTVTRVEPDEQIDLSGDWNDTDSRLVAEEMIKDVLGRPWLGEFKGDKKRAPVVIVGTVRNRTSEHIATTAFIKNLERELINSGRVDFVANKEERQEVRDERTDQQEFSSAEIAEEIPAGDRGGLHAARRHHEHHRCRRRDSR